MPIHSLHTAGLRIAIANSDHDRGHLDFPRVKLASFEGVHLHTPALQTGTHFLLTLETIVFLFPLL